MSAEVEQKILEMMQAKKIFLKKYKRAKQLFNDLTQSQKRLLDETPRKQESCCVPGNINVLETMHLINEIRQMLFDTDPLILNSVKNYFSTDDYFFHHALGVCYIGTIVLNRFNEIFSRYINNMITAKFQENLKHREQEEIAPFFYYAPEAIRAISMGYLIHDMGKIMVPASLLNKKNGLSRKERKEMQKHVGEYGISLLKMNGICDVYMENIIKYHHAAIYVNEKNAYPEHQCPSDLPPYVKICKLADIYSAMTLKRSYGEAVNSGRDPILQLILYSFVKAIGTCPEGSILTLKNGQSVYVINRQGPEVIIFTDRTGRTIETTHEIINLSSPDSKSNNLFIDGKLLPKTPIEMFNRLPLYLQEFHMELNLDSITAEN